MILMRQRDDEKNITRRRTDKENIGNNHGNENKRNQDKENMIRMRKRLSGRGEENCRKDRQMNIDEERIKG